MQFLSIHALLFVRLHYGAVTVKEITQCSALRSSGQDTPRETHINWNQKLFAATALDAGWNDELVRNFPSAYIIALEMGG